MNLLIFGLSVSSSWGNGHATIWRGLIRALGRHGHSVTFFERNVPWYALHRDLPGMENLNLIVYSDWNSIQKQAKTELEQADIGLVTSFCPDAVAATRLIRESGVPVKAFYDLDTPVTLSCLEGGEVPPYLGKNGYAHFDLVLSYTGGEALAKAKELLGARQTFALYGSVDPQSHFPTTAVENFRGDLSYLGTYARDRQEALERLFIEPSRLSPKSGFVLGGAQYPETFPWPENIRYVKHVAPPEHPAFYCSSRFTLNITRGVMAGMGYCPSGRLFEAAACGVPVISDYWQGIDMFFDPGKELIIAETSADVIAALNMGESERMRIALAARKRVLADHTAEQRVLQFEQIISDLRH